MSKPELYDYPSLVLEFQTLAEEGCYCCDVWGDEDELDGLCVRCDALKRASAALEELAEHMMKDVPPQRAKRGLPPDPDCRICNGLGIWGEEIDGVKQIAYPCDCTVVCQCGEERPNNFEVCHSPGCTNTGCDACGEIEWCCDEHDVANGDWFCNECRS